MLYGLEQWRDIDEGTNIKNQCKEIVTLDSSLDCDQMVDDLRK